MELALFPLHTVLCPGVALPLHVFEDRYRRLVGHCIDEGQPFGVVLIREGREVGHATSLRLARVGTTALIREAGRYPDGRMDLVTVGGQRFRIEKVEQGEDHYLVGDVELLDEPIGDPAVARRLSSRVSTRFLRYLELLQPAFSDDDGPEIEVELVVRPDAPPSPDPPQDRPVPQDAAVDDLPDAALEDPRPADLVVASDEGGGAEPPDADPQEPGPPQEITITTGTDDDRREMLMAAARRLVTPDDPTALSYVLAGLVQIELRSRQALLEAPHTEGRLRRLDQLLGREIAFLERQLKPMVVDPRASTARRN